MVTERADFIVDLFDGLLEVSEDAIPPEVDGSAVNGLRRLIQRLNQELSFVRDLAGATKNIEAIAQKISEMAATTDAAASRDPERREAVRIEAGGA